MITCPTVKIIAMAANHEEPQMHAVPDTNPEGTDTTVEPTPPRLALIRWQKGIALAAWAILVGGYYWYTTANQLDPLTAAGRLVEFTRESTYGPLIYIGLYALRPLIFFSAAVLTVVGGFLFGPVWGVIYTVIAGNLSAMVAYWVGRYFGSGLLPAQETQGIIQRYARRLRQNSFETVLVMRFLFLPYDLVNYLAGFLHIDWKAFLLATVLGNIPGTISVVLLGASIEGDFSQGLPGLNPWTLLASAVLFGVSLALSRYFKRRETSSRE
ncbi:MAG: hypothetical protein KatS3mg050_1341 [Litorilinea sp.]|nr:MAG: hypothetical protein KatS3mg050_1341 [Litorilinea sp.]